MYQAPTQPLTIGQTLDSGFSLFKASFSSVWLFALVASIAAIPMNLINPVAPTGGTLLLMMLFLLLYAIASIIIFGAIAERMRGISAGEPVSAGDAIGVGLRRGPALIGASLLYGIGSVIGFLLLVIPGIWFMVAFCFSIYATILDRKSPIEALRYSFQFTKGRWWRTAAVVTIIGIIAGVIYLLLGLIVGLLVVIGAGGVDTGGAALILNAVVAPLIQIVLVPLSYSLFIALYNDYRLRHEGSDLAARISDATE